MEEKTMENTEELEIDIDDIGTILKSSRLKSKKSMEEISSELCIRKMYLIALEEGDYETLPPIPYGVGYVRTYAKYLGLNPERAVKLYKAAASQTEEQNREETSEEKEEINKSSSKHIILGILAILIIYAGWNIYSNQIATVTTNVVEEEQSKEEIPVEEVSIETEAETTIPEEVEEKVVEEVVEQTPIPENIEENKVEENKEEVVENKVVIEFTGESWAELKDKNKVYFQGVYHEGDKKEIDYIDNLFLSVGRPENIKVYVKGSEKDILAKKRKMNIPLDSLE